MEKPRKVYHKDGWIITEVGKPNIQRLAEGLVRLMRREKFNGEIDLNKYKEISKAEESCNKKEVSE
ncbi:hypothetical protein MNO09_04930 [Bacillus sp. N5-665]|uniref:hypothetical protein n=1 Tax=Bacillus TaxID=1386 RepID=UPI0001A0266F|nr:MULTISPECIES: hypothetical protein [Bacillus]EEK65087.1 hypothetical protein bcere0006_47090 [Bacillus wiedmannii]EJV58308.1 hypothetical protein IEO_04543 [Bacillus wiedmannii]MCC2378109.1 hypothetical protein [Bacillus wiedmannii]MCC2423336.1 hypothetical protein [Bacillus wiedmannii]UNK34184.1 hypothetical protein MNO09_04930 [Bacillus sp. N5-665]